MKRILENKKRILFIAIVLVFFLIFALIDRWTPSSGDDWVYGVGGMWNNPFEQAYLMYQTWSGRYLSELWGFIMAPRKQLWNIVNPCLFTGIFLCMIFLTHKKEKHLITAALLLVTLILSVPNRMRMQTYSWTMGSTYVVPLLLFFLYLILLFQWLEEEKITKLRIFAMALLQFCIPLYMENAAALLVGSDLLVLLYLFFHQKEKLSTMVFLTVFGIIGTCIIYFSPGAQSRLTQDNAEFNALSLFGKISFNWNNFLEKTWSDNVWVMKAMAVISMVYTLQRKEKNPPVAYACVFINSLSVLLSNAYLYILETILTGVMLWIFSEDNHRKYKELFFILCALGADAVMVISPIFDSRSAIYTVYLWILLILDLLDQITYPKKAELPLFILTAGLCFYWGLQYYNLYHMVHLITIKRDAQIQYYQDRPDAGDAWILAYPDDSIHSPNVLEGDTTHDYYFKEFYYLNQDLTLHFYYLEDYTAEAIAKA